MRQPSTPVTVIILIEDKVHAGLHGDQLVRYFRAMEERFRGKVVTPIFLKTGDQSSYHQLPSGGAGWL
jgi:hypothetical protein